MRTLLIDVETAPNLAYVWSLWKENVQPQRLVEPKRVMCFAAKWAHAPRVSFYSEYAHGSEGTIKAAHSLLSDADVVITYNGDNFDLPLINREMLKAGLTPPAPYKSVDLYKTVKRVFEFPSMKMDYVCRELGIPGKIESGGFDTWTGCLAGDSKAWARMRRYNVQDVRVLEALYAKLRPWVPSLANVGLYDSAEGVCPACGSSELRREGFAYTALGQYQRYQCKAPGCGRWSRGSKRVAGVDLRSAA